MKENDILSTLCRLFNSIADTAEIIGEHISEIRKVNKNEEIARRSVIDSIDIFNVAIYNNAKGAANEIFWQIMAKRKQKIEQEAGE